MTVDPEWTKKFFNQEDYRGAYHLVDTDMIGIYTPANQQHPALFCAAARLQLYVY